MPKRSCGTCEWFHDYECGDEDGGDCRKALPTMNGLLTHPYPKEGLCSGVWPNVHPGAWCGEHKPRIEPG